MGKQNRQRRAAKQKRREARTHRPGRAQASGDLADMVAAVVWETARALADGGPNADDLLAWLVKGPDAPGGHDLVAAIVEDAVLVQRSLAEAHGWTEADIDELRRRRSKSLTGDEVERGVRWLGVLIGIPPLPPVTAAPQPSVDDSGMLAKVRALLAKAESTTFPEEAESLTAKAQELMARHRIDRAAVEGDARHDGAVGRRIWLDDPYVDAKSRLVAEVANANRCQAVHLTGLGCSHVIGFAGDLDVVELLFTSLLVQATTAMAAAGQQVDRRGRSRTRSFRQSFLVAFAWRIGQRLREATDAGEAEGIAAHGDHLLPVLARRDDEVEAAVDAAFPRRERRTISASNEAGWAAGTAAAELADLSVGQQLPRA